MGVAKGFVIFFTGRVGSTYLVHRLRQHPEVRALGEVFGTPEIRPGIAQTAENQLDFARQLYRAYRRGDDRPRPARSKARGFKIQYHVRDQQLMDLHGFADIVNSYDVVVIRMIRNNTIKQAVSAARASAFAEHTAQVLGRRYANMHRDVIKDRPDLKPGLTTIDPHHLLHQARAIVADERALHAYLARFPQVKTLSYEELMRDKEATLDGLFRDFGVSRIKLPEDETLLKMTSDTLSDVIANFDECRQALNGTEFESQLVM